MIISEDLAPAGYAYLLVWEGQATLATCLFDRQQQWRRAREATVEAFSQIIGDLDLTREPGHSPGTGRCSAPPATPTKRAGSSSARRPASKTPNGVSACGMPWSPDPSPPDPTSKDSTTPKPPDDGSTLSGMPPSSTGSSTSVSPRQPSPGCSVARREPGTCLVGSAATGHPAGSRRRWPMSTGPASPQPGSNHRDRACHSPDCDCVWCTHATAG